MATRWRTMALYLAALAGMLLGLLLTAWASARPLAVWQAELLRSLGLALFATFLVSTVYSFFLRHYLSEHVERRVADLLRPAIADLAQVGEEARGALFGMSAMAGDALQGVQGDFSCFTRNLRAAVQHMVDDVHASVGLFETAHAGGILNIYPDRRRAMVALEQALSGASGEVRIAGISLGDFFLDRGQLCLTVQRLLDDDGRPVRMRCLLADPAGPELRERARWEAGEEFCHNPLFYDSTTFVETDGCARKAKFVRHKHGERFEARLYCQAPISFVVLTNSRLYVEQYHYAGRGSNAPLLEVDASSPLYRVYVDHFEGLWRRARPVEDYDPLRASGSGTP
jgi:hypothetical protein